MAERYLGAVFDVDGVLVDSPHEVAWRESLEDLSTSPQWADVLGRSRYRPESFTSEVYQAVMSGKPRRAGAVAVLQYFGVTDADRLADIYGERKQARLVELIDEGSFHAFPDAVRFALRLKQGGIRIAAASSSKNARRFLERISVGAVAGELGLTRDQVAEDATMLSILDGDVSGRDFPRGKPDPMIFLAAAEELGYRPERGFVIEDAASGIEAARAGRMGALAISRADDEERLVAAGADPVVKSLDLVDLGVLAEGMLGTVPAERAQPGGS